MKKILNHFIQTNQKSVTQENSKSIGSIHRAPLSFSKKESAKSLFKIAIIYFVAFFFSINSYLNLNSLPNFNHGGISGSKVTFLSPEFNRGEEQTEKLIVNMSHTVHLLIQRHFTAKPVTPRGSGCPCIYSQSPLIDCQIELRLCIPFSR